LNICKPKPGFLLKAPKGWHKKWNEEFNGEIVWDYKK